MQASNRNLNIHRNGAYQSPTTSLINEIISSTSTISPSKSPEQIDREQIRRDFYATYDVMTGVRIAATLGGFFGFVVLLVLCKSKSKTQKALADPHFAAVAAEAAAEAEAAEEEEQVLKTVLEATATWTVNHPRASRFARRSLGNFSAPPSVWTAPGATRFSSVSGNLFTPTVRSPGSALKFQKQAPCMEFDEEYNDDSLADEYSLGRGRPFRRTSSATCSSSDSSYLERRGSSVVVLPPPPPLKAMRRKSSVEKNWDFYSIDIKVIQPTPDVSPSGSERMLYTIKDQSSNAVNLTVPRLAPLATISSCASSVLGTIHSDYVPDIEDQRSLGSDSVFAEGNLTLYDTDDEITPLGTDSDDDTNYLVHASELKASPFSWKRRCSAPMQRRKSFKQPKLSRNYESTDNLVDSKTSYLGKLNDKKRKLGVIKRVSYGVEPSESGSAPVKAPVKNEIPFSVSYNRRLSLKNRDRLSSSLRSRNVVDYLKTSKLSTSDSNIRGRPAAVDSQKLAQQDKDLTNREISEKLALRDKTLHLSSSFVGTSSDVSTLVHVTTSSVSDELQQARSFPLCEKPGSSQDKAKPICLSSIELSSFKKSKETLF